VAYSRDTAITWPRDTTRRQLVISGGWQPDERFAWLIADGTKVIAVYRTTTQDELDELVAKVTRGLVFATVGSPDDKNSWGIAGAIKIPDPPPPPEPGGFPEYYVDRVMTAAWRLSTQLSQPVTTSAGKTFSQP
jgi:hypothetical protein